MGLGVLRVERRERAERRRRGEAAADEQRAPPEIASALSAFDVGQRARDPLAERSLAELLVLSLCDATVLTPMSSFSEVAAALARRGSRAAPQAAGLHPHAVDPDVVDKPRK